ncbi:hypothetical protein [Agrococcus carbonis]|uniref:Uncharacterized protein n=1 Tax=Agrococcus carbonis TaxID=684552 RepID=A0A1H1S0T4_9MICO|nr:hypothetical protein [Agrococcus carbonis]SDS41577.1 hypothetical protein SAMN04489719_2268 [Agrococcus carbonis]
MTVAQHRAPIVYAVSTRAAVWLAIAVGLVSGMSAALASAPEQQRVTAGIALGLALGLPAAVAVVLTRRAVEQGAHPLRVAAMALAGIVVAAALLFGLVQVDAGMAAIGALLGVTTGVVTLLAALWLAHTRRRDGASARRH